MSSVEAGSSLNVDAKLSANAVRTSLSANDSHSIRSVFRDQKIFHFLKGFKAFNVQTTRWRSVDNSAPLLTRTSDTVKQVRRNETKINQGALSQGVSVPDVLMNSFVLKKCVYYAQFIDGAELQ